MLRECLKSVGLQCPFERVSKSAQAGLVPLGLVGLRAARSYSTRVWLILIEACVDHVFQTNEALIA